MCTCLWVYAPICSSVCVCVCVCVCVAGGVLVYVQEASLLYVCMSES